MSEERWVGTAEPVEPISRSFGLVAHSLELATRPPDDIGIDPLQGRTQLRLVEVTVVDDPAADARQRLRAGGGLETAREDASVRLHPHDLSGSKLEAQKVEADVGEVAAPVHIL